MAEVSGQGGALTMPAIGGYLEIELPASTTPAPYPQALRFQSARAAFLALLRAARPSRVWIPHYICGTMLASLEEAGVEVAPYRIGADLRPAEDIRLGGSDWVVYVNYFGICSAQIDELLDRVDRKRVVIDSSQALFAPPCDCLATLYSPRKFLGVPDGGLLVSELPVEAPALTEDGSYDRALPLLKRLAFSPEEGYAEHQLAEATLVGQEPKGMSALTAKLLSTVDYERVRCRRNDNFALLHRHLGRFNALPLNLDSIDGALCYPLLANAPQLRDFLIGKRIFVARYWPDVLERVDASSCEEFRVQSLIALPCDQRYGEAEMNTLIHACMDFLSTAEEKNAALFARIEQMRSGRYDGMAERRRPGKGSRFDLPVHRP
jgi:hypothetical protein